jgi:penicillin-binding protein 2B
MGQRPTFDLNTRDGINNSWQNLSVETSYEPGSVMKIFTLAAAVQQNVFDPNETYKSGKFYVKNVPAPIKDWNSGAGWGTISYLEGLQRSSNVAFSNLLDKIGQNTFRNYLDRFHFGQPTNIGLPNETSGKILYKWPIERYTTAFGQGTTVSAMQIIQAATAIANDGKMMKPYVVDKIIDPNTGKVQSTDPKVVGNPISADTAKQVRDYLRTVVTGKYGTGTIYDLPGYDVTGKTGTAQIPGPDGKYLTGNDNYIYSFIGMAPKDDPKLIVYVAVQQPHLNNDSGSIPVQMIFNPVMKNSLEYLNIKPNNETKKENTPKQAFEVPNLIKSSLNESKSKLNKNGLQALVLGNGNTVVAQSPKKQTSLLEGEKVILKTNGDITMPDMKNWSSRDILRVSKLLGLRVNIKGNGYLKDQSIPPNSIVNKGDTLTVNLTIPK